MRRAGTPQLRIVLYPGSTHSRTAMHAFAAAASTFLVFRMATGGPVWAGFAWYFGTFVGVHALMVPVMTAWHALLDRVDRYIRGVIEEELTRFDMRSYRADLERLLPRVPDGPPEPKERH